MKQIPLTRGLFALIDDDDFCRVSAYKWYAQSTKNKNSAPIFYAARRQPRREGGNIVLLHRWLLCAPRGIEVDHENQNSLDCQRDNLRLVTSQQNSWNTRKMQRAATSTFKGVCCVAARVNVEKPWLAYIGGAGRRTKRKYLGYFSTEQEAAKAYDVAAYALFGEFAKLNFP